MSVTQRKGREIEGRHSESATVSQREGARQRDRDRVTVCGVSLGSGGSSEGHPIIPSLFVWKDLATATEVLFAFDHGYGGGLHLLPDGTALYCAWNTDNGTTAPV